ncbi:hypothetical protein BCEN4_740016 [Burkholderia cenocepacia]|nr:hypothetical protein BCEN4_740016 [Burkholderia cenocepacia]
MHLVSLHLSEVFYLFAMLILLGFINSSLSNARFHVIHSL